MTVQMLARARMAELSGQPFTYDGVGRSLTTPPHGYRSFTSARTIAGADFTAVVDDVLTWQVQARCGLHVAASSLRAQTGAVVEMRLGVGPLALRIPCRVVTVIDEPDRRGFAYGTLPGHPESGEEAFLVRRVGDGVEFTVTGFSRPASRLARLGGPVTTQAQRLMTARYLHAVG